jgi:hypothetical protein
MRVANLPEKKIHLKSMQKLPLVKTRFRREVADWSFSHLSHN